ncbi:lectin-like domain-containing protein, partial [Lysinibacillus sp.]
MGRSIYCSRKLSIFLIFVLLFQSLSSSIISVASAEELINNYTDNLYFTEKGQNERIQEFKVENQVISLDLVLQEGQDSDTKSKLQLPEGLSLKLDNPLQEGLTYDENTQTVFVDWTKFTLVGDKKRVSLSLSSSLTDNVNIQATMEQNGQIFYSQPLNITPVPSETPSTTEATSDENITSNENTAPDENAVPEEIIEETPEEEQPIKEQPTEDNHTSSEMSSSQDAAITYTDQDIMANATGSNPWLTYKFDNFPMDTVNQLFTLNGTAAVPGGSDIIRLTSATPLQSGAVFNKDAMCPKNNYSFSTAFSFSMNNANPAGASDGLTFTISTKSTSEKADGGGLGYYGINPSFAVKYDTFLNDVYKDPSSNYIGLAENGSVVNQTGRFTDLNQYNTDNGTNFVLSNGTQYYSWIDYDGLSQIVQVRLGTSPDRASSNIVLSVNNVDLGAIFGGQPIHAGFTASTGYPNYENHDINSWYFVNDLAPITTLNPQNNYKQAPSSVELATEPIGNSGEYNVTATLLDPLGNPVSGASLDTFTSTSGVLTGPNGEALADLVSDTEGKIHAVLKNADYSMDNTLKATIGCKEDTATIPASNQPPTDPPTESCPAPVALINGSFEEPTARMPGDTGSPGSEHAWQYFLESEVPGWKTSASDKFIQIMKSEYLYGGMEINPPNGNQYAELNAEQVSALYQDVETIPGQTIYWRLAHKGGLGVDTMSVQIGSANIDPKSLPTVKEITTDKDKWVYYSGTYTVPAEQTTTRFAFNSIEAAGGDQRWGNLLDDIFLGTVPCVTAEKTVSPEGEVSAGDELTYEVTIKNNGGDVASNAIFEDAIPAGTEYVPGSLKITNGQGTGDLTDANDSDKGHFDGDKVIVKLGDLPNTSSLPDGITVQFKVKALLSGAGTTVANKAQVNYRNLLTNTEETTNTNEVSTLVNEKGPVLQSEKVAVLKEKAAANTDATNPEVGDTLLYTIYTQNTISNSMIKNLVISDAIPKGLAYQPGSLKVDGVAVTDEQDTDKGHFIDGVITGQFGDITDMDWHVLTFEVKVQAGQAGLDIKNVATVTGDNI